MFDARTKLNEICGFPKPQSTGADLVKHLIENTENRIQETTFKEGTAKALLLLSKWQEWRWSHNHIISRLLEVMAKVCKMKCSPRWQKRGSGYIFTTILLDFSDIVAYLFYFIHNLVLEFCVYG